MKVADFRGLLFWTCFEIPNLIYFFCLESGIKLTVAGAFSLLFNIDGEDMVSKSFGILQYLLILPDSFEFLPSFPSSL